MTNPCKILILFVFEICFFSFTNAQTAPQIQWQNTIGGDSTEILYSIQQTTDSGYILGGYSKSIISGDKIESSLGNFDYWIVKTDSNGNIQWQNTIGGNLYDVLFSIEQTTDGGYILGGYSKSDISGDKSENCIGYDDYWIVKTDSIGNIQWQNTIGGDSIDYLHTIHQTLDGGYILGGRSFSNISGDKTENSIGLEDYWIVKTDSVGNIQWQNTIGGSNSDQLQSIRQTSDSGYILGGTSKSNISGDKTEDCIGFEDYWIVKTDSSGNIQWQNTIGGSNFDRLYSIQQTFDEGFMLGGHSQSNISGDKTENCQGIYDYWIVKTDSIGNIQWQNTIGGSGWDVLASIVQTSDNGYIIGGISSSGISGDKTEICLGNYDYWIVKTNSNGTIEWQNTIGGGNAEYNGAIQQTADNGYILSGVSESNISGDKTENSIGFEDYWIVKIAPDTATGISPSPSQQNAGVTFAPNPFTDELSVNFHLMPEKVEVVIYDVYGRIITRKSITATENIIQTESLINGIYFVEVLDGNRKTICKVIKQSK